MVAAGADEIPQGRRIHAIQQSACALVGGVEHRTHEPAVGHQLHEGIVGSAIGKHHADDLRCARQWRQRAGVEARRASIQVEWKGVAAAGGGGTGASSAKTS